MNIWAHDPSDRTREMLLSAFAANLIDEATFKSFHKQLNEIRALPEVSRRLRNRWL